MKTSASVELVAGLVWAAIGTVALIVPGFADASPRSPAVALAEIALCLPVAIWLGWLTAQALARGSWAMHRGVMLHTQDPAGFWSFTGVAIVIAGVFLSGFVRGVLSICVVL